MAGRAAPYVMLSVICAVMVIGFIISPGPVKHLAILCGWAVGTAVVGLSTPKAMFQTQIAALRSLALLFAILSVASCTTLFLLFDGEWSSFDGILILASSVMLGLAVSFGLFWLAGFIMSRSSPTEQD